MLEAKDAALETYNIENVASRCGRDLETPPLMSYGTTPCSRTTPECPWREFGRHRERMLGARWSWFLEGCAIDVYVARAMIGSGRSRVDLVHPRFRIIGIVLHRESAGLLVSRQQH